MKKQYTRKQITEAIRYWTGVLKQIDESKSEFLNLCSEKFGEDVVFSEDKLFELTDLSIKELFKLLDDRFFSGKLMSIQTLKLFVGSPASLNPVILDYSNQTPVDLNEYVALYQPDRYDYVMNGKRISVIRKDGIFVNVESRKFASFSYIAQALCHEMIHAYDMHFGSLFNYMMWALGAGAPPKVIDYNSHFTKMFKLKKQEFAMQTNIDIPISADNMDFDAMCRKAAENIHLLKEDELDAVPRVTPEMVKRYGNTEFVQFSKDGKTISFSFGIPMPN